MTPFNPTADQEELRRVVRAFLEEKSSSERVRALIDSSAHRDPDVWSQLAGQLALTGLAIPEEFGGLSYGPTELGVVLEEMGRALLVAPFFSTVALVGQTLTACADDEAKRRWLPLIADGSLTATVAVADSSGSWELNEVTTTATRTEGGWSVTGTKMFVLDGHTADLILVAARDDHGLGLFAVEGSAPGVTRSHLPTADLTRQFGRVEFAGAPAIRIEPGVDATGLLTRARDLALVALSAEQIGGAGRCLDMAVAYAQVRVQFGRPIGSFQAIKHKCANLLTEIESGRSAVQYACAVVAEDGAEGSIAAALAKAHCSQAFTHAAKENIQIHGGIGYTWEHDAHLYLRRAKMSELLFGSPARHRARLAELVGL